MQLLSDGFLTGPRVHAPPLAEGPLSGVAFAVKDVMAIRGAVAGMGHPLWLTTHAPEADHAHCVRALLSAGAELVGKTHTDELTYSLAGCNHHYGMPPNPRVPDGIPGGSSSGSASVVAAGHVPLALGSDTGGSVRIPASYCGIFGIRPTHGAVHATGVAALAPSFDTIGWFASDAALLRLAGEQLLPAGTPAAFTDAVLHPVREALELADADIAGAFDTALSATGLTIGPAVSVGPLDEFLEAFRVRQAWEAWQTFGPWIEAHQPVFGPGIRERFAAASATSDQDGARALDACQRIRSALRQTLGDGLWCLPTAPTPAPRLDLDDASIDAIRYRTLRMTAIAGLGGLPQVSLPLLAPSGGPVGLSLIGPTGSDRALLALAESIASGSP